jgi:hypothetical protein
MLNLLNTMVCAFLQCGPIVLFYEEPPTVTSEPRVVDIEHCQRRTPDCIKYKNLIEVNQWHSEHK